MRLSRDAKLLLAPALFRPVFFIFPLVIVSLITVVLFTGRADSVEDQAPAKEAAQLSTQWGIAPVSLRLSAAGHIVDFRYRVTDPEKASSFLDVRNKPSLIDQSSGTKLSVPDAPKVGSLRQKTLKPEAGRIYFILFGNPGVVKDGSKVTLIIGDVKIENLTVEGEFQPRTQ